MYERILVPVDLRDESSWKTALPKALDLVERHGGKIWMLTVVPDVGLSMVAPYVPDDHAARAVQEARTRLGELVRQHVPQGVQVEHNARAGSVYGEILKEAEAIGAGLIVMASHRPELKDYLLGPNAARVVRHATCSVLVARE